VTSLPGVAIVSELGRGASAVTYRVLRDGRDYAMKVYAGPAGAGREALLALRREATLLTWVDHPALTRVYEVGQEAGQAYMILDLVGDEVIAAVAQRLSAAARSTDVLGRYGGEEFVILLVDTAEEGAMVLAERLRAAVGGRPIETAAGPLRVTVSVGVACLTPEESVGELLERADTGLYASKRDGRDRVSLA
jgi:hypothetical protein